MDLDVFGNSDYICVAIEVRDNGLFEEEMEQFTVILSTSDDVDISSQRNTATVIFIDNEGTVLCPLVDSCIPEKPLDQGHL